jgi:hypothetical protein
LYPPLAAIANNRQTIHRLVFTSALFLFILTVFARWWFENCGGESRRQRIFYIRLSSWQDRDFSGSEHDF